MKNIDFEMKKANYIVYHMDHFWKKRVVEQVYTYSLHDAYVFLFSKFNKYWNSLSGYGKVWDPKTNTRELVKINVKDKTICLLNYMNNFQIYDCKNQVMMNFIH